MKDIYKPEISKETETKLWENAIFVWDTSAICSLYSLTDEAKTKILDILEFIEDRVWIPARVYEEYERHRLNLLRKPKTEHYKQPDFLSLHYLKKLDDYLNVVSSDGYYHPRFTADTINRLRLLQKEATKVLNAIRITTENAIDAAHDKIEQQAKSDIIKEYFDGFSKGKGFSFTDIMDIIKEGSIRYEHSIPPGYMDSKDKDSIDKFGDLIIWKEICKYAQESNSSVIFICNDLKEDWNAGTAKNNEMIPREELLKEFHSASGKDIWFYTLNGFISKFCEHFVHHEEIKNELDALTSILRELQINELPDEDIKVICNECHRVTHYASDDFDWDWELSHVDERNMGEELCFTLSQYFQCPFCNEEHAFEFEMYQYPINVVNYASVTVSGCKVVSMIPPERFIEFVRQETCVRCGELSSHLNCEGYCQACMDEFDYECSKDD